MRSIVIISFLLVSMTSYSMKHIKRLPLVSRICVGKLLMSRSYCTTAPQLFDLIQKAGKERKEKECLSFLKTLSPENPIVHEVYSYQPYEKTSALDLASREGLSEITRELLFNKKVDPNKRLGKGRIALHNVTARHKNAYPLIIEDHKKAGADFSAQDEDGNTLIHTASQKSLLFLLARNGAPLEKPNKKFIAILEGKNTIQSELCHIDKDPLKDLSKLFYGMRIEQLIQMVGFVPLAFCTYAISCVPYVTFCMFSNWNNIQKLNRLIDKKRFYDSENKIACTPLVDAIARADACKASDLVELIAAQKDTSVDEVVPYNWPYILEAGKCHYLFNEKQRDSIVSLCARLSSFPIV